MVVTVAVVVKPKLPVNDGVDGGGATQWGAAAVVVVGESSEQRVQERGEGGSQEG